MKREFHIFASQADTRFIVKGVGEGFPREFPSLFEAARHARTRSGCDGGLVVIYDQEGNAVNRIPFPARIGLIADKKLTGETVVLARRAPERG